MANANAVNPDKAGANPSIDSDGGADPANGEADDTSSVSGGASHAFLSNAMDQIVKNHADLTSMGQSIDRQNETLMRMSMKSTESADAQRAALKQPTPPTQEPFKAPETTSVFDAFGSAASVFGIMASLMTKTPITSALNAAGATMQAYKARDADAFKSSLAAWKEHTEQALKQYDTESKSYHDAFDMIGKNDAEAQARIRTLAAMTDNQYLRATAEAGRFDLSVEYLARMDGAANNVRNKDLDPMHVWMAAALKTDPNADPQKIAVEAAKLFHPKEFSDTSGPSEKSAPGTQVFAGRLDEYKKAHNGAEPPADLKQQWLSDIQKTQAQTVSMVPTRADQDRMRDTANQIPIVTAAIDDAINDLKTVSASVGVKGRFGMAAETLGNMLDLTDDARRHTLQKKLEYISQSVSKDLLGWEVSSRISEGTKKAIRAMVGGKTDIGVTWQETVDGLNYLKRALSAQQEALNRERFGLDISPEAAARRIGYEKDNSGSSGNPWDSDPAVGGH